MQKKLGRGIFMIISYAPVVIFGYNRADHLIHTINTLGMNKGALETPVYLFLDGYKNEKDKEAVKRVHEFGKTFRQDKRFKSIEVCIAEKNQGLAKSVIHGVSKIIEQYGKVIVLEDDIVTSRDFLCFMNDALQYYEYEKKIWSISGYTFDLPTLSIIQEDVYLGYRASSWGWATWADRWNTVDWGVKDYNEFRYNILQRMCFNRGGTNMSDMLDRQMAGEINSWAIRWCYAQYKQDKLTVFPRKSKVLNIGQDGSGTHCNVENQYDASQFGEHEYKLMMPELNQQILREFKNRAGLKMTSRVKRFIRYNILRREKGYGN